METVLVTGGAGYIGSHAVKLLLRRGYRPVIYDSLARGYREALLGEHFVHGNLHETAKLVDTLQRYNVAAVIHFAAFAYVGESVHAPLMYYQNNVAGTLSLLQAMQTARVNRFIFSSTAAVYGVPLQPLLTEDHPQQPINPYGESKLFVEHILRNSSAAGDLRWISLRYFNAAGADLDGEIGERHDPETHLIPLVLAAASGRQPNISIFGTDYDTPDGTCVRDFIHVHDLAEAHLLALQALDTDSANTAYNLGSGSGYSVREIIDMAAKITERPIPSLVVPRRPGDPSCLVASADKARQALHWTPQYSDLETIIATAWRWECRNR